jgi:exfoliative toxin A/B
MLILIFTYRYILNDFNIEQVYASYWIVYVGITMASITGLSFDLQWVTWIFCVFGFVMMFITFPIVTYRYLKYPVKQEANKPLICIYAAIFNILIVGYVNSFSTINYTFLLLLYIIATLCYLFSLYKFITYRKMPFYPSFSAFTFPFVISAIASLKINDLFNNSVIEYLLYFECTVAAILVIYVLIRYSYNYLTNEQ